MAAAWPLAAAPPCQTCHPKEEAAFARTGMGQSLGRPRNQPGGSFRHDLSGSIFSVTANSSGMRHRIEQGESAAEYEAGWYVGSGRMGRSYLVPVDGYLFQSPASWYSARRRWNISPGYEQDHRPDFNRKVVFECLFCHSGGARPVKGTQNRYEDPPFEAEAITCQRCHGPGEAHAAAPSKQNIVNPVRLAPQARDSVCEQCHLGGEARIPNPGARFDDFQPGKLLEEVFTVFVAGAGDGSAKVVSHAEQLAASVCRQRSGERMWCGSCHDPHEEPNDPAGYYRQRCLSCHRLPLPASHPKQDRGCTGCHMPKLGAADVRHAAVTDHRIVRHPGRRRVAAPPRRLAAWREPPGHLAVRNLGLAYVSTGERDQSAFHLNEGFLLLAEVQREFAEDPAVLTSLGLVLLRKNTAVEAAKLFERALRLDPRDASHYYNLAVALRAAGDSRRAAQLLEQSLAMDPIQEEACLLLAEIYGGLGLLRERRQALERFLQRMPQNIQVRMALSRF